jgi:hypothetical protein
VSLNQLHEGCGERIRYKKTCPVHGEIQADEIVMGYELVIRAGSVGMNRFSTTGGFTKCAMGR